MIKLLFTLYRTFVTARFGACRYVPSCSEYAEESIEKYGMLKGIVLAVKRIISCHPFSKKAVLDPVN